MKYRKNIPLQGKCLQNKILPTDNSRYFDIKKQELAELRFQY